MALPEPSNRQAGGWAKRRRVTLVLRAFIWALVALATLGGTPARACG